MPPGISSSRTPATIESGRFGQRHHHHRRGQRNLWLFRRRRAGDFGGVAIPRRRRGCAGNLFIADSGNNRIRKVSTSGIITDRRGQRKRFSGDGGPATSAALYGPSGVAVDGSGNLFVADTCNRRIRKVSPGGTITTVAGNGTVVASAGDGGPATSAALNRPEGLAVDSSGISSSRTRSNNRIRKVSTNGTITTVAGSGAVGFSGMGDRRLRRRCTIPTVSPWMAPAISYRGSRNNRIRKVSTNGIITTVAGSGAIGPGTGSFSGDGGPAASATLNWPQGVAVDTSGNFLIADTWNNRIRKAPVPLAPSIAPGGIAPVYSTVPTIQPGEWVSIYGTNLATSTANWTGNFPASLGGTSVTIDGKAAALSFVSPTQINLQVPDDAAAGAVPVVVTTVGGAATATVTLAQFAPAFLLLDAKHVDGIILRSKDRGLTAEEPTTSWGQRETRSATQRWPRRRATPSNYSRWAYPPTRPCQLGKRSPARRKLPVR